MKATGIIRRTDDLGRVVIPKEIRRQMKIEAGAPLEIFLEDNIVCFKPYNPIDEQDWGKAKKMLDAILDGDYVLTDPYQVVKADRVMNKPEDLDTEYKITINGDVIAILNTCSADSKKEQRSAVEALKILFETEG